MVEPLVECVPNVSEGRNVQTIQALVAAIRAVPRVHLLDHTMDPDHHRAVLTFAGAPEAVAEAAFQVIRVAANLIDLNRHQGEHPRVGATDVVPFVPLKGVRLEDCNELAKRVGQRIGGQLQIPVFLYGSAATRVDRADLADMRRGGLQGLAKRMGSDPKWAPDFGPTRLHPTAGATAVGVRPPLVAFNVNLRSRDVALAKGIAKTVRHSGGGLAGVKAMGVHLDSRRLAQVSMNLTDLEQTPIHVAFEAVSREAARRGVGIAGCEIVGLIPRAALSQSWEFLKSFEHLDATNRVLEDKLGQAMGSEI
ncbi:MAG: glutamate formimidoyltransferase [Nitrospiraceae bacterium]